METRMISINDYKSLLLNQIDELIDIDRNTSCLVTDGVKTAIDKFKNFVDRKEYWVGYGDCITKDEYRHYVPQDKFLDLAFKLMEDFFSLRQSSKSVSVNKYFLDLPTPTGQFKAYTYIDYKAVYHGIVQEGYYTTHNTAVQYDNYTENVPIEFILKNKFGKIIESYDSPHFIFATPDEANASGFLYSVALDLQYRVGLQMQIIDKKIEAPNNKEDNWNGDKQETTEA